jgi:hypothetical protein
LGNQPVANGRMPALSRALYRVPRTSTRQSRDWKGMDQFVQRSRTSRVDGTSDSPQRDSCSPISLPFPFALHSRLLLLFTLLPLKGEERVKAKSKRPRLVLPSASLPPKVTAIVMDQWLQGRVVDRWVGECCGRLSMHCFTRCLGQQVVVKPVLRQGMGGRKEIPRPGRALQRPMAGSSSNSTGITQPLHDGAVTVERLVSARNENSCELLRRRRNNYGNIPRPCPYSNRNHQGLPGRPLSAGRRCRVPNSSFVGDRHECPHRRTRQTSGSPPKVGPSGTGWPASNRRPLTRSKCSLRPSRGE